MPPLKRVARLLGGFSALLLVLSIFGCATMGLRKAVNLHVLSTSTAPANALVHIDEQYVGTLKDVARRGVRLPEGWHRITVEKNGYYPFETRVHSDRKEIRIKVEMLRLPD